MNTNFFLYPKILTFSIEKHNYLFISLSEIVKLQKLRKIGLQKAM